MKQLLPILFLFLFTNLQAQLVVTPNDETLAEMHDLSDDFAQSIVHYDIVNTGQEDVTLSWCIVQTAGPTEWESQLCVNAESGGCFAWGVSCNVDASIGLDYPFVITAADTSLLELKVRSHGEAGCGTFEVQVTPYNDPSNIIATGVYHFQLNMNPDCTALAPVSAEDLEKSKVHIFPNPTNNLFTISENEFVKEIEVHNMVGQVILRTSYNNGDTIDLSAFADGIYLVKMLDQEGQIFKSSKLVKR